MSDGTDSIIVDTATRIFRDLCEPGHDQRRRRRARGRQALWDALEESGPAA